jgi:hypothetical protein
VTEGVGERRLPGQPVAVSKAAGAQVPRLNVHYAHIATVRRAERIVANAASADVRPSSPTTPHH